MLYPLNGDPASNMRLEIESPSKSQALLGLPRLNVCKPISALQTNSLLQVVIRSGSIIPEDFQGVDVSGTNILKQVVHP